jgi:hypothetical protein
MKTAIKRLKKMSEEDFFGLYDIIDNEMEKRSKSHIKRGYQRTTYLNDRVRGKRRAPRWESRPVKKAA